MAQVALEICTGTQCLLLVHRFSHITDAVCGFITRSIRYHTQWQYMLQLFNGHINTCSSQEDAVYHAVANVGRCRWYGGNDGRPRVSLE